MPTNDSTFLQPPAFDPTLPVYPELPQLCRVSAPSIGGNVYPGFVQQYAGNLNFRDREACYVIEPNNVALGAATYDCRLVGSYLGLPLYATTCCVSAPLSSSSSSSSAQAIARTPLGTASALSGTTIKLSSVTVPSKSMLIAVVSSLGAQNNPLVTFGSYTLDVDGNVNFPAFAAFPGSIAICSVYVPVGDTKDLVLTLPAASAMTLQALYVTGLNYFVSDVEKDNTGIGNAADTGVSVPSTIPVEFVQAAFALLTPAAFVWQNGFTSGGQDVSLTVQANSVQIAEGWRTTGTIQALQASLSAGAGAWAGLLVSFG